MLTNDFLQLYFIDGLILPCKIFLVLLFNISKIALNSLHHEKHSLCVSFSGKAGAKVVPFVIPTKLFQQKNSTIFNKNTQLPHKPRLNNYKKIEQKTGSSGAEGRTPEKTTIIASLYRKSVLQKMADEGGANLLFSNVWSGLM